MPRYISPGDVRQVLRVQILRCRHDARRRTAKELLRGAKQRGKGPPERQIESQWLMICSYWLMSQHYLYIPILYDWHAMTCLSFEHFLSCKLQRKSQLLQDCVHQHIGFQRDLNSPLNGESRSSIVTVINNDNNNNIINIILKQSNSVGSLCQAIILSQRCGTSKGNLEDVTYIGSFWSGSYQDHTVLKETVILALLDEMPAWMYDTLGENV